MTDDLRARLSAALAKPAPADDLDTSESFFDPWYDVLSGIAGDYSTESDLLMLSALEAVRDGMVPEFVSHVGFPAELALYILAGHDMLWFEETPRDRDCGPGTDIADLWQPLLEKWRAYSVARRCPAAGGK